MRLSILFIAALVDLTAGAASYSTDVLVNVGQVVRKCGGGIKEWNGSGLSATFILADCQNVVPVVNQAIKDTDALSADTPSPDDKMVDEAFDIAKGIVGDIEAYSKDAILKKQKILQLPIVGRATALRMIDSYKKAAKGAIEICLRLAGGRRSDEAKELERQLLAALEEADKEYRAEL